MSRYLRNINRRGRAIIVCFGLLSLTLVCLLGLLRPVSAEVTKVRPIRSVKLITQDEAGLPIRYPAALAYDPLEDEIYITSPLKNKLVITTADYFPYLSVGSGRGLSSISGSFIKDGILYVCVGASNEDPNPHIAIYDGAFLPRKKIYFPQLEGFHPTSMVLGATGKYYVVGLNNTGVIVLDQEGNFERIISPLDEVLGVKEKAAIIALDVDSAGRLYFLSESMGRVYVYDKQERFFYKFGEKGGETGKLARPHGIAIDEFRRQVYIVDYQRHSVSVYAITGEFQFEFGGLGNGRGWFQFPNDIIVDGQGRLLVADTFNHRIQVFEFVGELPPGIGQPDEFIIGRTSQGAPVPPSEEPEFVEIGRIEVDLPADARGDFLVLTSLARDPRSAEALAEQLQKKGYPVHIQPLDRGARGVWQQVLVGPYVDPLEAYEVAERLRSEELLPAILKTRGESTDLMIPVSQQQPETGGAGDRLAGDLQNKSAQPAPDDSVFSAGKSVATAPDRARSEKIPVTETRRSESEAVKPILEELAKKPLAEPKKSNNQIQTPKHVLPHSDVNAVVIPPSKKTWSGPVAEVARQPDANLAALSETAVAEVARATGRGSGTTEAVNQVVAEQPDFCVRCHLQRIAKVCMPCHPQDRRDRI